MGYTEDIIGSPSGLVNIFFYSFNLDFGEVKREKEMDQVRGPKIWSVHALILENKNVIKCKVKILVMVVNWTCVKGLPVVDDWLMKLWHVAVVSTGGDPEWRSAPEATVALPADWPEPASTGELYLSDQLFTD